MGICSWGEKEEKVITELIRAAIALVFSAFSASCWAKVEKGHMLDKRYIRSVKRAVEIRFKRDFAFSFCDYVYIL